MILVTGANGHLGQLTIDFLVKKQPSSAVSALVRDTAKGKDLTVALRQGDYSDYASLVSAFKGVDTLVLISSGSLENRVQQHVNAINAAKENGVKHIIYTSMLRTSLDSKFTVGIDHVHTEEALKASGVPYTVLRNTFYVEVLPMLAGDAIANGNWYFAGGNGKANFAARIDMAEALANVAANPAAHANKVYEITSSKAYTLTEVAALISKVTGKPFTYTAVSAEDMAKGMTEAGLPGFVVAMLGSIAETIAVGELDYVDAALENILQRKPLSLEETLTTILK